MAVGELERQALLERQLLHPSRIHSAVSASPSSSGAIRVLSIGVASYRWCAARRFKVFKGAPVGDADDPGRDARLAPELARPPPNHPHRVIDDFLGELIAARQARQEARQAAVIDDVQIAKRVAIACRDPIQQHADRFRHDLLLVAGRCRHNLAV